MTDVDGGGPGRLARLAGPILVVAAVLVPWGGRLRTPNLVGDDVQRVIDLQTLTLPGRMLRPFNEHLAPLFEVLTAAAWGLAGRRLAAAPRAFTLASYLPFALTLGMLWALARREWRSATAAGALVVVFGAAPVYAECVLWFSASTFTWALLFTVVALDLAGRSRDRDSPALGLGAALACLIAPTGSAIGLLAGPAAALRALPTARPRRPVRAATIALLPAVGTAANLLLASLFRYHEVLARGVRGSADVGGGLSKVVEAPAYLLLTGYAGVVDARPVVPRWASAAIVVAGLVALGLRAARARGDERRWLAIGLVLIGGGYALIYGFRTTLVGPANLVTIQRYHLFPCLGLALAVVAMLAPRLRRLDACPRRAWAGLMTLAVALAIVNRPVMVDRSNFYRMQPAQGPTLAMMDRLADLARARGLSRDQILAAFPAIEPRWTLAGWNALRMLPESGPGRPLAAESVRAEVLGGLPPGDRPLLFGDMNASPLLVAPAPGDSGAEARPGRLVAAVRIRPDGPPDHYRADGWPSHLEFAFAPGASIPRALALPGLPVGRTLELWWAGADAAWSPDRRVVVRLDGPPPPGPTDRLLPLDRLPQLDPASIRRLRLTVREPGPVALGTPALLR